MAITVYSDLILKNGAISSGFHGKSVRVNQRIATDSGIETINAVWSQALREYEFGTVPLPLTLWKLVEGIYEITMAGVYGFLLEDPKDYKVGTGEGKATLVTGATYQLYKRYSAVTSTRYHDRKITRPKSSGFAITYNGGSAGAYTLDATTGRVTLTGGAVADPTLLAWTGEFYVPVHFSQDIMDWDLIAPGNYESRYVAGPTVTLSEVRE